MCQCWAGVCGTEVSHRGSRWVLDDAYLLMNVYILMFWNNNISKKLGSAQKRDRTMPSKYATVCAIVYHMHVLQNKNIAYYEKNYLKNRQSRFTVSSVQGQFRDRPS